jgi:hypothetical protein
MGVSLIAFNFQRLLTQIVPFGTVTYDKYFLCTSIHNKRYKLNYVGTTAEHTDYPHSMLIHVEAS